MAYLGVEPRAAGWKAQTNQLSYGGTPNMCIFLCTYFNRFCTFSAINKHVFNKNCR